MIKFYKNLPNDISDDFELVDLFELFLKDLFEYRFPSFYKRPSDEEFSNFKKDYENEEGAIWVYYPWLRKVFKILNESDYFEVLTSRNKPYVSHEEQRNFYEFNVGIVGMSVGQSSALTIARGGGSKNIKIADPDIISPSNLNRLHLGISSVGKSKVSEVKKSMLEINPFLNIKEYTEGFTNGNSDDFFTKDFKIDVVIDACDDFMAKLEIRKLASKYQVPVIMATDLGDGSLIDIERYDIDPNLQPFGGRHKMLKDPGSFLNAAIAIISPENIPTTLMDRFFQIGKTAPTHPQLANSVFLSGALVSYLIRCLANKRDIVDERVLINFDELFDPEHKQENFEKIRKEKIAAFKNLLGME